MTTVYVDGNSTVSPDFVRMYQAQCDRVSVFNGSDDWYEMAANLMKFLYGDGQ